MKNLEAKRRDKSDPYEVWEADDWKWLVLKKWQADDNKQYARWFCMEDQINHHNEEQELSDWWDLLAMLKK